MVVVILAVLAVAVTTFASPIAPSLDQRGPVIFFAAPGLQVLGPPPPPPPLEQKVGLSALMSGTTFAVTPHRFLL